MQILTRPEARKLGHKTYYTGRPCKNGHDIYRYTQSGTCSACVRNSNLLPLSPEAHERKKAIQQMVITRVRIHDQNYNAMREVAWALAVMRFPAVRPVDIEPRLQPTFKAAGTAMYPFYCHHADVETLNTAAIEMTRTIRCDMTPFEQQRAKLIYEANHNFHDTTPPENWK